MNSSVKNQNEWVSRWNYVVSAKPIARGIWSLKDGGYLVRVAALNVVTGNVRQRCKVLRGTTLNEAERYRLTLLTAKPTSANEQSASPKLWLEYAQSLYEAKVNEGRIKSAKSRERWVATLARVAPYLGGIDVDKLTFGMLMDWRDMVAKWLRVGMPPMRARDLKKKTVPLAPASANTWISVVKTVCAAMTARFELPRNPAERLELFPLPRLYSREQPNALTVEQVPIFLAKMKELFPQHYAMTVLGFSIGARPSSLRPLRRRGACVDILWPTEATKPGRVLLRRSHTRRDEIMDQTKTGVDLDIPLPASVMGVLREHVAALDGTMEASDLLFPATTGSFRSGSALDKLFREVTKALGWSLKVTPRAMRRTFQDMTRSANVADVVTRAISGHATTTMQVHYSTAQHHEMLAAVRNVVEILLPPPAPVPPVVLAHTTPQ